MQLVQLQGEQLELLEHPESTEAKEQPTTEAKEEEEPATEA